MSKTEIDVVWIYPRKEGDIEVHAPDRETALRTLRAFGFVSVQPDNLRQASSTAYRGEIR